MPRASGPGFLLQVGAGASPSGGPFTTVAEVKDIRGPEIKLDVIDVTNQSSPGGYEEVIPSIRRSGNVTFDVNFNPTDPTLDAATGLIAALNARTLKDFRLLLNDDDDTQWEFSGYVVGFDQTAPVTGVLGAAVTIKVSGPPVLGPQ